MKPPEHEKISTMFLGILLIVRTLVLAIKKKLCYLCAHFCHIIPGSNDYEQ